MSDPIAASPQQIQEGSSSTVTVIETDGQSQNTSATVHLKLRKPRTDRKVQWSTETVDNENLNKKKSKCCCIYDKPRKFGESSSSESDDECDHCHGHVEKKKKKRSSSLQSPSGVPHNLLSESCSTSANHTETELETQNPDTYPPDNIVPSVN